MNKSSVNYDVLTPVKFLERSAEVYPKKTAIVHGDQRTSYALFLDRVYRLANALRAAGIK